MNIILWVKLMGKEEGRGEEKMPRGRLERWEIHFFSDSKNVES